MRALIVALLLLPPAQDPAAPAKFKVKLDTTKGDIVLKITREWAPKGADRFHALVKAGYYDDCRFYRVLPKYIAQFGINGTPAIATIWANQPLKDDPVKESNKRGSIAFATVGPNSRTTQVFINYRDNPSLDKQGFAPFGRVADGMNVVEKINAQYGEKPQQARIQREGTAYLDKEFGKLDYVKTATLE